MFLFEFLSKLEYHDTLNTSLFDGYMLKSNIKNKLIQIAHLFRDDCKLNEAVVQDYHLVGGNCNFNYTTQSDIDVHLIVDFSKINSGTIDLADYFKAKKELWSDNHTITIAGYPVELYVQDVNESIPMNQGCYSLTEDRFIITPKKAKIDYDDPKLQKKVESFIRSIRVTDDLEKLKQLKNKLKTLRTIGLQKGGEFSIDNLLVKSLRNRGYIEMLDKKYKLIRDKQLSL